MEIQGIIACLAVAVVITILMPIGLAAYWGIKKKVRAVNFFTGAVTFYLFVIMLESSLNRFLLGGSSSIAVFFNQNKMAYILYGILAAGIFEETGRYLIFRFVLVRERREEAAVAYGIGHGGMESIILVGIPLAASLGAFITMNYLGGLEPYLAQVPETVREATRTGFQSFFTASPADILVGAVERISAIAVHISLSVLVFQAAAKSGKLWMYPLAIVLHALFNVGAALFQTGIVNNIYMVEVAGFLIAGVYSYFAWRVYRQGVLEYKQQQTGT